MTIRPLIESDYDNYIVPFWESWGSVAPVKDFLSDIGMIVFDDNIPVCAAYLYVTNSSVCWAEWCVSDKNYTNRKKRKFALRLLLDTLINLCVTNESKYVFAVIKSEPLIKIYEDAGFTKGGTGIEMFKKLKN